MATAAEEDIREGGRLFATGYRPQSRRVGVVSVVAASGRCVVGAGIGDGRGIGPEWKRPTYPSGLAGMSTFL